MFSYRLCLPEGAEDEVRRLVPNHTRAERTLCVLSEITKRNQVDWLIKKGYAVTSYDHLERGVPRWLIRPILRFLTDHGFVERDRYYIPKKLDPAGKGKSYAYRPTPAYRGRKLVRSHGQSLAVRSTLTLSHERAERRRLANPLPYPCQEIAEVSQQATLEVTQADLDAMPPERREKAEVVLDLLQPQHRWAVVDEFGRRIHLPLQVIPRWLRYRVRLGESTSAPSGCDVVASQPLILIWALRQARARPTGDTGAGRRATGKGGETARRGNGEEGGQREQRGEGDGSGGREEEGRATATRTECKRYCFPLMDEALHRELDQIQGLILAGSLYETLIPALRAMSNPYREEWEQDHSPPREVTRADAKRAFLMFSMGNTHVMLHSDAGRAVRLLWPRFWEAVYALASSHAEKHIARVLQRKESQMMQAAAARILRERPGVPFYPVHDSIVCNGEHTAYVQQCIEGAYADGIGVRPRVRVEPYAKAG